MKYINSFNSVEDYIVYKENNTENLPGVNRVIEDNILTTTIGYPHSFVFIDDENNTNYNIIKYNSVANDIEFNNNIDIIAKKQLNYTDLSTEDSVLITKNYKWDELKTIPLGFVDINSVHKLNKICYLPDTIETIESGAFYNCTGLTSIKLPKNLKSIEIQAFQDCNAVKELIFTSKECPDIDNIYSVFDCNINITNLVLPCPYINNYVDVINGVKELGYPEITINGTNINIISPVNVDTTGNDNIELSVDIIDYQTGESISSFNSATGTYYARVDASFNTTGVVIDNLVNEKCSEIINTYNTGTFQIPAITYDDITYNDKTYTITVAYLGKTATTCITQPCAPGSIPITISYLDEGLIWNDEGEIEFIDGNKYRRFTATGGQNWDGIACIKMRIDIDIPALSTFDFYIGSNSEPNRDFVGVRLDNKISYNEIENNYGSTNKSLESDYWYATSAGDYDDIDPDNISQYKHVEFPLLNNESHFIEVAYVKDMSGFNGDDLGFIVIPNKYEITKNPIWGDDNINWDCGGDWDCDCVGDEWYCGDYV